MDKPKFAQAAAIVGAIIAVKVVVALAIKGTLS